LDVDVLTSSDREGDCEKEVSRAPAAVPAFFRYADEPTGTTATGLATTAAAAAATTIAASTTLQENSLQRKERKEKNSLSNRNIYCSLQKIAYFKACISLSLACGKDLFQRPLFTIMERKSLNKQICKKDSCETHANQKRSTGREGETLVLFCVCTVFLCRFLCVCRLLCQTSL
jgi:hypothetical protein